MHANRGAPAVWKAANHDASTRLLRLQGIYSETDAMQPLQAASTATSDGGEDLTSSSDDDVRYHRKCKRKRTRKGKAAAGKQPKGTAKANRQGSDPACKV